MFPAFVAIAALLAAAGCGKKGPPLPPLVKLPTPPANFAAVRRGDTVDLQFTVPQTNTDNTRPANVTRVDVYALTGAAAVTDADLLRHGVRVGSVAVKAPKDPNLTTDPDEPEDQTFEPPEGTGLAQGAVAHVQDALSALSVVPTPLGPPAPVPKPAAVVPAAEGPLLGPSPAAALVRTYVGVAIAKNGRKGQPSTHAVVPLMPPPPAPAAPTVVFDENAVTVTWESGAESATDSSAPPEQEAGLLPARPIAFTPATLAYQVYETPDTKLTKEPIAETRFSDARMDWGTHRCYAIRTVQTVNKLAVESDASPATCVTLVDTFPPAAPQGLKSVGTDGAISLIWDANTEKDLDGYIVLRGLASDAPQPMLVPITPAPIHDTTFRDGVAAGIRYVYEVRAVDKAGNVSESSDRVEEAAR